MLLLSFSGMAHSQTIKDFSFNFDVDDFTYSEDDGLVKIVSKNKSMVLWGDTLDPALPYLGVSILISPIEEYCSFTADYREVLVRTNAVIEPNPIPVPTNMPQLVNARRHVAYTEGTYPKDNVIYTGTHCMDGYKYLSFLVCPFSYDALNNNIYLKTKVSIKLKLKQSDTKGRDAISNRENIGKNMRNMVRNMVVNGDDIEKLYTKTSMSGRNAMSSVSEPFRYIIVTNETLRPAFEKLARWKTIKGVRTKVVTVEECDSMYPNSTSQIAIKSVLANYYNNGMEYALLGGDTNIVPAQICYHPYTKNHTVDTPADLFYACLDNSFSWNGNGNNIYGEISDNVDFDPEFIVTRTSVSNLAEAEVFINRIIEYESYPKTEGWTKSFLSCGNEIEYSWSVYGRVMSDAQMKGENVYSYGVQSYWQCNWTELFDTFTSYGDDYDATGEHFQIELQKGYTFVDEFSHGWANCWGWLENDTKYTIGMADSLINNGYSVITTIACYTNAFDKISSDFPDETGYYTTCLSEAFIRNPQSGIIAYLGSSRDGWPDCSDLIDEEFYKSLFTGSYKQFGRAAMSAKNAFLPLVTLPDSTHYRCLSMSLNPIGDPEMPIYTETPQLFTNVNITFSNETVNVTTGVSDCRICVSSASDYGNSYYELSDSTNSATFSGVNDDCFVCITKTGYIPYLARVGTSVFLQNETIKSDLHVFSTTTDAGRNVTSLKPQGPVSIEKGKLSVRSQGNVTLKNDFEVKLGAELEIFAP